MDEIIKVLSDDLAYQRKKLHDLIAWGSLEALINEQNTTIGILEKKIEAMQGGV